MDLVAYAFNVAKNIENEEPILIMKSPLVESPHSGLLL